MNKIELELQTFYEHQKMLLNAKLSPKGRLSVGASSIKKLVHLFDEIEDFHSHIAIMSREAKKKFDETALLFAKAAKEIERPKTRPIRGESPIFPNVEYHDVRTGERHLVLHVSDSTQLHKNRPSHSSYRPNDIETSHHSLVLGQEVKVWDGSHNMDFHTGKNRCGIDSLFKNHTAKIIGFPKNLWMTKTGVLEGWKVTLDVLLQFPNGIKIFAAASTVR